MKCNLTVIIYYKGREVTTPSLLSEPLLCIHNLSVRKDASGKLKELMEDKDNKYEVGIYESKQENTLSTKKKREKTRSRPRKRSNLLVFFCKFSPPT